MSSVDGPRGGNKVDPGASRGGGDWKGQQRDHGPHTYPVSTAGGTPDIGSSLRARIGEKEATRSAPHGPTASYRSDMLSKEDERDNRKRTVTGG
jgi:THO complex subunit 2